MKIYQLALEMVASVYRLAEEVQRRDREVANQMRRAAVSVVLNMAEGMYSQGGTQGREVLRLHGIGERRPLVCMSVSRLDSYRRARSTWTFGVST